MSVLMSSEHPPIEPIKTAQKINFLDEKQLENLQEATLTVLENVGVQFPSEKALAVFAEHDPKFALCSIGFRNKIR